MDESTCEQSFPDFFADAPAVTVQDPLARFLGAARDGVMEYRYADAVRLAGHSCPTVAGTWLMTLHGLRALYGDELPVRGEIEVYMADARDAGTTGVMATVAQLVTGAAPETGFHGIGGRFGRNNLLHFDQPMQGTIGLRRKDTGAAVQVELDASVVPWPDEMRALLPKAASGQASTAELQRFGELWQERVRKMLVEHADDGAMVQVSSWTVS
ncbi:FmdE family protein [Nitrosomonas sp.]|uniref:FmdE family protein n=1 Tax=Nitrosomonas sp. TaxID=42353 RepID=UPI0025CC8195|nr:FmdE family protein [Nitrosomonas sp.]MCC6916789.1 hypothetical protein [Nitrosomonas sp.]